MSNNQRRSRRDGTYLRKTYSVYQRQIRGPRSRMPVVRVPRSGHPQIASVASYGFGTSHPVSSLLFARGVARWDSSAIGMRPRSTRSCAPVSVRSWNNIERQALRKDCARLWRFGAHVSRFAVRLQRNICARLAPTTVLFRRRSVLPARDGYPPAMIAAFGISDEPEPGVGMTSSRNPSLKACT